MEKIKCTKCKEHMPKLRLVQYGYSFCVNCSTVSPKVGRIRVVGEGDHTATVLDVLDQSTAKYLQEMENNSRGVKNNPLEILNYDEDEVQDDYKALAEVTEKVVKDEFKTKYETIDDEDESEDEKDLEFVELELELEEEVD